MAKRFTIAEVRDANVYAFRGAESMYFTGYEYVNGTVYETGRWGPVSKRVAKRVPTTGWLHQLDCPCKYCKQGP